jgi:hypothetical protein
MNLRRIATSRNRRAFLVASGAGIAGLRCGRPRPALSQETRTIVSANGGRAKSVILFFLCGGASHIDTWDMKPDAPVDYRGPFSPIATSVPDIRLCEHLPLLAKQAHHLAVINSVSGTVNTNDHHAGYYHQLTGHVPDTTFLTLGNDRRPYGTDWPFIGVVAGQRMPRNSTLPGAVTLPHKPSKLPYTRPGQFAARLGAEFDPLYVDGSLEEPLKFQAPSLTLSGGITAAQFQNRAMLLQQLDGAKRGFEHARAEKNWEQHQERAMDLLLSAGTTEAFNVASEPESVRERYGTTVNGMSLLLARRLVEAGVPFVTVFWKENEAIASKCKSAGGWDTHGNNFGCLKEHLLPEFDRAFSTLLADLHDRGLLEETLVFVTSEMGRTPKIGDPRSGGPGGAGRDHWTHCLSVLMAGGGVGGSQVYGASDRLAEFPADRPVTPADIAKTVYHAAGIRDLQAVDAQGRPYHLLEEGRAISELFS